MMKSALSSAFSIMPASLRPAHLSAHLPLPQGKGSSTGGSPRQDLPRSPSPTYHFHAAPGSGPSSTPSTPGGLGSAAADASTSAFSAAVAANGKAAAAAAGVTSHAFARSAKRPVPLRSVTASPTVTTDNLPPSYPPAPHSAGVLVTSPVNTTFAPSLRSVHGNGGGGMPRSQPASPAQNRFPLAPLSASVGPAMTNPFGNNSSSSSGTPSAVSPSSSRRGSAGPQQQQQQQQPASPAAPRLTTSLSNQGGGPLPTSNQYTGLGVAGLARRNTVDAGVSGVGVGGSVSVNMGAAPPVRRSSAMGDGIQQRRPVQDPSNQ